MMPNSLERFDVESVSIPSGITEFTCTSLAETR